jgi:hypothetical protein
VLNIFCKENKITNVADVLIKKEIMIAKIQKYISKDYFMDSLNLKKSIMKNLKESTSGNTVSLKTSIIKNSLLR